MINLYNNIAKKAKIRIYQEESTKKDRESSFPVLLNLDCVIGKNFSHFIVVGLMLIYMNVSPEMFILIVIKHTISKCFR
jgi:hypothetical protein